jgi:hypothetical protein
MAVERCSNWLVYGGGGTRCQGMGVFGVCVFVWGRGRELLARDDVVE